MRNTLLFKGDDAEGNLLDCVAPIITEGSIAEP